MLRHPLLDSLAGGAVLMEPAARRAGIATPSSGNHGRIVGVVISGGNVDGTVFARAIAEG
jgi:hypothetical protein